MDFDFFYPIVRLNPVALLTSASYIRVVQILVLYLGLRIPVGFGLRIGSTFHWVGSNVDAVHAEKSEYTVERLSNTVKVISEVALTLTRQFADEPTRGQSRLSQN